MKYERLNYKQKKYICNGCGAKGGRFKPPEIMFLTSSCDHHDYGYWKGGSEWKRWFCNFIFLKQMVIDAHNYCVNILQFFWYLTLAVLYFMAVQLFGWKPWYYCTIQRSVDNYDWDKIYANYEFDDCIPWENYRIK